MAELMAVIASKRPDDVRVVGAVDRAHLDHRVVVDEVVQPLRAHHEAVTILPRLRSLRAPVTTPRLDQVDDAVGEHLGVDAQVAACRRGSWPTARRDGADAHLERRPVRDELGDVLADAPLDVADLAGRVRRRAARPPRPPRSISLTWMKLSPSVRGIDWLSWAMTVFAAPDRRVHRLDRRAERAEAVLVGRASTLIEDRVERQDARVEEGRDVREEDRDEVGAALVDRLAGVRADEQGPVAEVAGHLGRQVRAGPRCAGGRPSRRCSSGARAHEGVEEQRRRGRGALDEDLLADLIPETA